MFGGHAFMVNDKIVVSAWRNGDLLVRVPADRTDELCARPGVSGAEMGNGRRMGAGWITVAASAVVDEPALAEWLTLAMEGNRALVGPDRAAVSASARAPGTGDGP